MGSLFSRDGKLSCGARRSSILLSLTLLACVAAVADWLTAGPAQGAEPDDDSAYNTEEAAALNQILFRDRQLNTTFLTTLRALEEHRAADTLTAIQRILDYSEDSFVWRLELKRHVSVRSEVERLLSHAGPELAQSYENLFGGEARALLTAARVSGDMAGHAEIARRFFHTAAGFEAVDWLASWHFEHGSAALAAQYWDRLLAEPVHRARVTSALRAKAALAHYRQGNEPRARELVRAIGDEPLAVGGRIVSAPRWLAQIPAPVSARGTLEDWPVVLGTSSRIAVGGGSAPLLKPVWRHSIFGPQHQSLQDLVQTWEDRQYGSGLPVSVASFPLVVGGKIVFRDAEGVLALNAATGQSLWRYRGESSLATALPLLAQSESKAPLDISQLYIGNALLGALSSDGQRVFAVDALDFNRKRPESSEPVRTADVAPDRGAGLRKNSPLVVSRDSNRLVALPLSVTSDAPVQPAWSVGGATSRPDAGPLAGHFFLGPPLPVDGLLYVLTEYNDQLNLIALRGDTGQPVWSQGIALVTRSIDEDAGRSIALNTPSYANGIVVCPTDLGVLVAVDSLTGDLLWNYHYAAERAGRGFNGFRRTSAATQEHAGFPNLPLILGQTIVYLPRQSGEIHCVDLRSGEPVWKVSREDAEYIATISDGVVLAVGRRVSRGLSLATGAEVWSARLGMPSGRGVQIGSRYLLPLSEGVIANLDIATGTQLGYTKAESNLRPGNLIVHGDSIISLSPSELAVLPQAESMLAHVLSEPMGIKPFAERQLVVGELQLRLGRVGPAKIALQDALAGALPSPQHTAGQDLLRELLYIELRDAPRDAEGLLDSLAELSRTPPQRGQYLMQRAESQFRRSKLDSLLQTSRELAALNLDAPLPLLDDPSRKVAAAAWLPDLLGRALQTASTADAECVPSQSTADLDAALRSGRQEPLEQFLALYRETRPANAARRQLAMLLSAEGRYQAAELLLLQNRASADEADAAEATRMLVELWEQLGLYNAAGALLAEMGTRFDRVILADGRTGGQYLIEYPRDLLSWSAARRLVAIEWPVEQVRITERRELNSELRDTYSGYRRRLTPPMSSTFELLDKGRTETGHFVQVDKESGVEIATIDVPAGYSASPATQDDPLVGHLLPIAGQTSLCGISLLERGIAWNTVPEGMGQRPELTRVGPAGPSFASFQTRQSLVVLEPGKGRVLWQRDELEPGQGLFVDPNTGFIGDGEALVLFAADRATYTVFATRSGEEVRRGKIDVDIRQYRLSFGRMLLYVTDQADPTLKLWDPLTDRVLFEEPFAGRLYSRVNFTDEVAFVLPNGQMKIVDGRTGRLRLSLRLSPEDLINVNYVRVFADAERYYVNLQRSSPPSMTASYYVSDSLLPTVHIHGSLYAIDAESAQILWNRQVGQETVLHLPQYRLPFLVVLSRIRGGISNGANQSLRIETLDCGTGRLIGSKSNIFSDRLLHLSYDRDRGELELRGAVSQVMLHFGPEISPLRLQDPTTGLH